ncbi:chemosensory receptor A [Elysia marginata]|uniref:Chemosensory receptor A n=1 Tax=Elysia marginata TaxID=1093978 RepID=A0AAV4IHU5_9GAST|nr:chemosensory receptor A [Elysia marginata]
MDAIYSNATLDSELLVAANTGSFRFRDPISAEKFLFLMECLTYAIFTVGFVGITGNILILCTYWKVGFTDSINISYMAMAVSDLGCVASIVWSGLCWNPGFNSVVAIEARDVVLPTGGFATTAFGKITAMITAFISLERCLCVVFPLKVKTLITRQRTIYFIALMYVVHVLPTSLVYVVVRFEWHFSEQRNRTVLGVKYLRNPTEQTITDVLWVFHSLPLQFIPLIIVVVCTIFLIITLNRSARWRSGNSKGITEDRHRRNEPEISSGKPRASSKEDRIIKTVILIAIVFIVCSSPAAINNAVTRAEPEYRASGKYRKLNLFVAGSTACLNTINSSVNIFIYYKMSSKFKLALKKLVCLVD